ncbi:deoxyribose-phosphate aldolase [Seongchinamella sediminis]|uniref:Deoxyribose-phosphate aldolase n=1 Tax=Seongchinamella sediminis TaxID=2283635 RepID=A0A3L7E0N0_9GAMM|nr:deoxyribose-phosphate aldolase [Seongchinamella sediminis]RLQ21801.1 deoxyribose-phosphate aldolase [Seongchinamella sediminis]
MTELARYIDHTLLKPEATPAQIEQLCAEAAEYGFRTVCVNSGYVSLAARCLAGTEVGVCSVVGFPLGAMATAAKAFEAQTAIADGAAEIDMVIPIGQARAGHWEQVRSDVAAVLQACGQVPLKVIFEACLLGREEIVTLCQLCTELGVAFVKTSTGFAAAGASVDLVRLMATSVGADVAVKASGGVRDIDTARAMIAAGASRLGTSSGVAILQGERGAGDY